MGFGKCNLAGSVSGAIIFFVVWHAFCPTFSPTCSREDVNLARGLETRHDAGILSKRLWAFGQGD